MIAYFSHTDTVVSLGWTRNGVLCDAVWWPTWYTLPAFLPRDAMRKCCYCCRPMSVRPPVTFVYCVWRIKDITKLLFRPGSTIILGFFLSACTQLQGEPFQCGY